MSSKSPIPKVVRKKARPVNKAVKKPTRGSVETYVLRTPEGKVLNLKVSASSSASLDKAAERYAEAMKRLAKR